jgi:hypothetical protein
MVSVSRKGVPTQREIAPPQRAGPLGKAAVFCMDSEKADKYSVTV